MSNKFITSFGPKILGSNKFYKKMDTTDQRISINEIDELFDRFFPSDEIIEDLENEKIEDFEDDYYDYDDRSEYGEDVALAQQLEAFPIETLRKNKR